MRGAIPPLFNTPSSCGAQLKYSTRTALPLPLPLPLPSVERLEGRDHLKDLGVDGTIISEWVLGK
jgi:hypothetical protein